MAGDSALPFSRGGVLTVLPSCYQQAIFEFLQHGSGHAVVDAVPGSGKTTTLLEAAQVLPRGAKTLFVAFNAHIARELDEKLRARQIVMECSTIHSLGKRILERALGTRPHVEEQKYRRLAKRQLLEHDIDSARLADHLRQLANFARLTLTKPTPEHLLFLIAHYDLEVDPADPAWPELLTWVAPLLEEGQALAQLVVIDFTDMVALPVMMDLPCPQYDYLFLDEAQDLNAAQAALILRCCRQGRILAVGDQRQSIYGFSGSDTRSLQALIERTQATVLPLSICYRCPTRVVALAAQVFPGIEAAPNQAPGKVEVLPQAQFLTRVQPGDLVLCRCTAPLVSQCLRLLRAGMKAQVRGRDLGKSFLDLLARLVPRWGFSLATLGSLVEQYRMEQLAILATIPDSDLRAAALQDRVDTFLALWEAYLSKSQGQGTIEGFKAYLESFFTDEDGTGRSLVMLSTVHRAKGLEYPRVFLLEPGLLPHPAAKQGWQREQEENLLYVALTRAKYDPTVPGSGALYFVGGVPARLQLEVPIGTAMSRV
jgi:DNA helicase-2/ATP-dependent DNA helicase PcrA